MATILIIEDEPSIILILQELFKDSGYDAIGVNNGESGLKQMKTGPAPDLVIVDLNMPGIGGKDVIISMRQDSALKCIPVIIITGTAFNLMDFPPDGTYQAVLEKPFELSSVLKKVNELVGV